MSIINYQHKIEYSINNRCNFFSETQMTEKMHFNSVKELDSPTDEQVTVGTTEDSATKVSHQLYLLPEFTPDVTILPLDKLEISKQRLEILVNRLTDYAKNIESLDGNGRVGLQRMLNRNTRNYQPETGAVFGRFIFQNRNAVQQLIKNLGKTSVLLTPERGGGFLLDLIMDGVKDKIELIKIPKPRKKYSPHPKKEHYILVEGAVIQAISQGHKSIGLVDTMVSGASALHLVKIAQKLAPLFPEVEFTILIHQNTLHKDNCYGHEKAYPLYYEGNSIPISPTHILYINSITASPDNGNKTSYGRIVIANGNNKKEAYKFNKILGEDIGYQLKYSGKQDAYNPIIVFFLDGDHLKAIALKPSNGKTARYTLQKLIAGCFDDMLKQFGFFIEEEEKFNELEPIKSFSRFFTKNNESDSFYQKSEAATLTR